MAKTGTAVKETANLNLRVPAVSYEMLRAIAAELETSVNTVVNAVFEYALAPKSVQLVWSDGVNVLRQLLLEAGHNQSLHMCDFTSSEWDQKSRFYRRLMDIGFIEDLRLKPSVNFPDRVLCGFRLTVTGRIVARLLQGDDPLNNFTEQFKPEATTPQEAAR